MKLARADGLWRVLIKSRGEASAMLGARAIKRRIIALVLPDQVRGRDAQSPMYPTQ